jgi:hypothetical protein
MFFFEIELLALTAVNRVETPSAPDSTLSAKKKVKKKHAQPPRLALNDTVTPRTDLNTVLNGLYNSKSTCRLPNLRKSNVPLHFYATWFLCE